MLYLAPGKCLLCFTHFLGVQDIGEREREKEREKERESRASSSFSAKGRKKSGKAPLFLSLPASLNGK